MMMVYSNVSTLTTTQAHTYKGSDVGGGAQWWRELSTPKALGPTPSPSVKKTR